MSTPPPSVDPRDLLPRLDPHTPGFAAIVQHCQHRLKALRHELETLNDKPHKDNFLKGQIEALNWIVMLPAKEQFFDQNRKGGQRPFNPMEHLSQETNATGF